MKIIVTIKFKNKKAQKISKILFKLLKMTNNFNKTNKKMKTNFKILMRKIYMKEMKKNLVIIRFSKNKL